LLILHEYSDLVETIKTLSQNAKKELSERFGISIFQASAIMDLRKPLSQIPKVSILEEKENLKRIEVELKQKGNESS
jgi:DNA gyrase/topoisomerase IV subunit A